LFHGHPEETESHELEALKLHLRGYKVLAPGRLESHWSASFPLSDSCKPISNDQLNRAPQVVALIWLLDYDGCAVIAVEGHLVTVAGGKNIRDPN
jgi:hypothetical protein